MSGWTGEEGGGRTSAGVTSARCVTMMAMRVAVSLLLVSLHVVPWHVFLRVSLADLSRRMRAPLHATSATSGTNVAMIGHTHVLYTCTHKGIAYTHIPLHYHTTPTKV